MKYLPSGYGSRFLSIETFVNFCGKCAVSTDEAELEYLEKVGLLFPQRRFIQRVQYRAALEDQHHKGRKGWVGRNCTFDAVTAAQFEATDRLHIAMEQYHFPKVDKSRHHPLDCPRRYRGALVQSPVDREFRPWSQFMAEVGTWQGRPYRVNAKIDYYSYWQVYQLDAIHEAWRPSFYRIPPVGMEWEACILGRDPVPKARARGDFLGINGGFNLVSTYIQGKMKGEDLFLLRHGAYGSPVVNFSSDEHESLKKERKKYARRLVRVFRFGAKELSAFGRRLAHLSREYEKREKATLCRLIREDISYLGELVSAFLGQSRRDLQGSRDFAFFADALPDRWEELKLRTVWLLDSFREEYNKKSGEQLTVEDMKALVIYLDRENLDSLLVSVDILGETGLDSDIVGRNTTHMALQRISSMPEILMAHVMRRHPSAGKLVKAFLDPHPAIRDEVRREWKSKTRAISEDGQEKLYEQNLARIQGLNCSFLAKTLLTAFLVRNLLSHPFELFFDPDVEASHEIVRQLYFAILGVWSFAQRHYPDRVQPDPVPNS